MRKSHFQYVLIGAGAASASAAVAIRSVDPAGPLLLVGQEVNRPYHRPLLSRDYLLGERHHQDLFTHDPAWYANNHIDLRTHRRAAHLDTNRRTVSLDDGSEVAFDKLLIATGAAPRHLACPGHDFPNVFHLRTIEDADRLRHAIDAIHKQYLPRDPSPDNDPVAATQRVARRTPRAAVIGSGLLGLELASTLTVLGFHVDLFTKDDLPYRKLAGDVPARAIARYLEKSGVTLHTSAPVAALQGDGRAQRVLTTTGESTPCDLVLVAIGVVPHKELLRGTPIAAERAILTDPLGRTNVDDIFAAGDCAARFDPLFDKHLLTDHHAAATHAGRLAGLTMACGTVSPADQLFVPTFSTTIFDLTLRSVGQSRLATRRLARTSPSSELPLFTEFATDAQGRLTQILTSDPTLDDAYLSSLISRRHPTQGLEESLKDPSIPLQTVLPIG